MNLKGYILVMAFSLFLDGCSLWEASSDYLDYQTKTPLIFPVKGESLILAGGRTLDMNHHAGTKSQRFAIDVVGLRPGSSPPPTKIKESDEDDLIKTYSGDKRVNENYYLFGREVIAPADGFIHSSRGYIEDNIPGEYNKKQPEGNFVIIDHGNNEYSFMAHFKRYSLKVLDGQLVKAGDVIGLVGNSGNSSEPHLHYHLQTKSGEGLPTQFINYFSNGELVEKGEPVQWELISSK